MSLLSSVSKRVFISLWVIAFVGCGGGGSGSGGNTSSGTSSNPGEDPILIQKSDLVYLGAFRVPSGAAGGDPALSGYSYGGAGLAYNPDHDSLYLVGHVYDQRVGEISIPELTKSTQLSDLKTAVVLQGLTDITEGHAANIGEGGTAYTGSSGIRIGGLLQWQGRLIGTVYGYYDGGYEARLSHFSSGLNFPLAGDFTGMFKVGSLNPGFVGGYMTSIPQGWRSQLGGSVLTGNSCLTIITRTSMGPSASVFEPQDLGTKNPAPSTMLVGYPADHATLGEWGNTQTINRNYNMATSVNGIVFPEGTQSVLFFGRQGLGVPCYGTGTTDPSQDRKPIEPGSSVIFCYDLASQSEGCHAWPYASYVWAYDAGDLAQVQAGQRQPWDVKPYAVWTIELPFATESKEILGAAYDPTTHRIFLSQADADPGSGFFSGPVIHVLQVQ